MVSLFLYLIIYFLQKVSGVDVVDWLGRVDAGVHLVDLLPAQRLLESSKQLLSGATTSKMIQEYHKDQMSPAPVYQ